MMYLNLKLLTLKALTIIAVALLFVSCGSNTTESKSPIYGTWRITHSLADPGNGSAKFQETDSDKTLTFKKEGTVVSNENVCVGNFFTAGKTAELDMTTKSFNKGGCIAAFELNGKILEVRYQCMEACAERYEKVD
ncbi:hypothetical protein [Nonlabens ponticola]|uniref:Lipocalin-like domain-containing protein n=1 Tax=Nonlabens ponticola TaxID=2496866 RepID=A0A3S9MYH3_9FLAO|nr:hypothetical protein [Nonlabens ponticola]AZQ44199.1 hypothetical protein EJ995_08115 [Nonlabens ponticola]